jgi:hypothetical protein
MISGGRWDRNWNVTSGDYSTILGSGLIQIIASLQIFKKICQYNDSPPPEDESTENS